MNLTENKQECFKWRLGWGFQSGCGNMKSMVLLQKLPRQLEEFSLSLLQDFVELREWSFQTKILFFHFNLRSLRFDFCQVSILRVRFVVWSLPLEARGSRLRSCAASPARSIRSKCCPWCFRAGNTLQPALGFPSFVQKTLANVTNPWILPSVLDWLVVNFLKSKQFLTRCNIPCD